MGGVHAFFTDLSESVHFPNNMFTDNNYGFADSYDSYISTGSRVLNTYYNSIYGNTYFDVESYKNSLIMAQYDYWGGGEPKSYVDGTSTLIISNILTWDPWTISSSPSTPVTNNTSTVSSNNMSVNNRLDKSTMGEDFSDIMKGIMLERKGKIDEAINYYKGMIISGEHANYALTELAYIRNKYKVENILTYFENLDQNKNYSASGMELLACMYLQDNQFNKAMGSYDKVIKDYPNDYQEINARFEKLFAYLNIKRDKTEANKILSEIKSMNLKDDAWKMRLAVAENLLTGSNGSLAKPNVKNALSNYVPKEYSLSQNYPNPFNPTTTINYRIPKDGFVSIKVYDILGNEVETLINRERHAGKYSVQFNGSELASGIYFYTLRVNNFIATRKLLLLK